MVHRKPDHALPRRGEGRLEDDDVRGARGGSCFQVLAAQEGRLGEVRIRVREAASFVHLKQRVENCVNLR